MVVMTDMADMTVMAVMTVMAHRNDSRNIRWHTRRVIIK
jgi:hypothetical protein